MEAAARGAFRSQLTKVAKTASEFLESEDSRITGQDVEVLERIEDELCTLIARLTAVSDSIKTADQQVHSKKLIQEEEIAKDFEKIATYEDTAVSIISRLKNRLKRVRDKLKIIQCPKELTDQNHPKPTLAVKLPKLELKKFGGELRDWLPFWDQFNTVIHKNADLAGTDKFQYLENALYGAAKRAIAGFTPSAACYDAAVSLLLEQYGDNDKLVDNYMEKLLNLRPVTVKTDAVGLRSLYNTITTTIRSLTALQIPSTQYRVILRSILLRCLPVDLRVDYHRTVEGKFPDNDETATKHSDSPTQTLLCDDSDSYVQNILRYLKKEVEALEKSKITPLPARAKPTAPTTAASLLGVNNSDDKVCIFCNGSDHTTKECTKEMSMKQKRDILIKANRCFRCAKIGHSSRKCKSAKYLKCSNCAGKHITQMCDPSFKRILSNKETGCNLCAYTHCFNSSNVFLKTARVIAASVRTQIAIRLIIDGGSQHTYIKESLVERLRLSYSGAVEMAIIPFGAKAHDQTLNKFQKVKVTLKSQYSNKMIVVEAVVVPEICVDVLKVPDSSCRLFRKLKLADQAVIDMEAEDGLSLLIGSNYYWEVVSGRQRRLSSQLRAVETIFGWALQGPHSSADEVGKCAHSAIVTNVLSLPDFTKPDLSAIWSLESIEIRGEEDEKTHVTAEMSARCLRKVGARLEARIPWKDPHLVYEDNRELAVSRLNHLTKRLSRDPGKLREYDLAVRQMLDEGIAEPVKHTTEAASKRVIYLPHRPVYKENSSTTKLRIVFDASSHTDDIPSLNDQLFTGTNLLPDVFGILLNFRIGRVGVVADIEKAFLQITLNEKDRDSHRFLWYSSLAEAGKHHRYEDYRMTRVTFGVSCSPFLLSAAIRDHLEQEQQVFPETCQLLKDGFYVDDLVVSVDSETEGVRLCNQAIDIMGRASMNLRKWHSNSAAVRKAAGSQEFPLTQRVLGLKWSVFSDELAVPLESLQSFLELNFSKGSKRNILQAMARVYDPLGIVCPTIIKLKILFQTAWRKKLAWDETLPTDMMLQWNECIRSVLQLKDMAIPRAIKLSAVTNNFQCHIFADASIKAYEAVAYLQKIDHDGMGTASFLCAKSRVAPLKENILDELTLPKLELTAALVAARLCAYLKRTLRISICKYLLWTDSKITLNWIYGQAQRWKPYVQSRVVEIRRHTSILEWSHCSGKSNPADLITRGISGEKLVTSLLWERGPDWLNDIFDAKQQSNEGFELNTMLLVETDDRLQQEEEPILRCEKFNSWSRLLRVTCWVLRFISHCRSKERINGRCLSGSELEIAERYWLRYVQLINFTDDVRYLQKKATPKISSRISELTPFLDEHGLLRVGGRLQKLEDTFDIKHPIILPSSHHVTSLIVDDCHQLTYHGGASLVLTKLRARFWIVKGRQLIKKRIRSCVVCKKLFGQPATQPFAPLPVQRITLTRPFDNVGIDFAGPLYYMPRGGDTPQKAYILLFTCAAIRAAHLELTTSLSTECCLMAIRRFIARRGFPTTIFSDNAKTFRRAALELSKTQHILNNEVVLDFLSSKRIRWSFIVERAPWWGGFWERLIRTIKNTLKVVIGKSRLDFEQLRTILSETEAIANERPLTYVSNDPLDLEPLTPAKFLIGWSKSVHSTPDQTTSDSNIKELWKHRMKYTAKIAKRWRIEYLQLLRSFHQSKVKKSVSIQEGDVVLLFDPAVPRIQWKMVIVERIFPGRDGRVRACEVRCADGSRFRRPIQLLYPMELTIPPRSEDVERIIP